MAFSLTLVPPLSPGAWASCPQPHGLLLVPCEVHKSPLPRSVQRSLPLQWLSSPLPSPLFHVRLPSGTASQPVPLVLSPLSGWVARPHSSSVRQAAVVVDTAMLSVMALRAICGSSSIPAVMTSGGSMTANAVLTQSEVSGLSGSGPVMKPAWESRARFSSLRQTMSLSSASLDPGPDPANARAMVSGASPIQASSVSDSSERRARES